MTVLLWFILAVMTAGVLVVILRPLTRGTERAASTSHDAVVYREQLRELEQDVARGQIDPAEAVSARTEIARRLLAAEPAPDASRDRSPVVATARTRNSAALAVMTLLPVISLGLYLLRGAPVIGELTSGAIEVSDQALAIGELVAKVEERLRSHPADGRGWEVIAPVYFRMGRYEDAARAYQQAATLLGDSAARFEGLGESRVLAAKGLVTAAAREALEKARALDPAGVKPRFLLALGDEQAGRTEEAAATYKTLLDAAPPDSSWRAILTERLASLTAPAIAQNTAPGPTEDDMIAAEGMSKADREAMINAMISRLAERLMANDQDREGWLRLIRSLSVMGRRDDAVKALADARRALANDAAAGADLTALAKELGLES